MRITDSMMTRNYKFNVNKALNNYNSSLLSATTYRKFNKGDEDPVGAARAYKLRREYSNNTRYQETVSLAKDDLETIETTLTSISKYCAEVSDKVLQGITGTTDPDSRSIIATEIRATRDNIVNDLNAVYADKYALGGTSTNKAPFSIDDNGELCYRGINVNAAQGSDDYEKLKELANETLYVDIGLGMKVNQDGAVDDLTALNISFPGIKFMGYGQDEDGNNMNIYSLLTELADKLDKSEQEFSLDDITETMDRFKDQQNLLLNNITKLGSRTKYLEYTQGRLTNLNTNITTKINDVEFIDPYDAIMDFTEQKLIYNTSLQLGSSILGTSLFDFLS